MTDQAQRNIHVIGAGIFGLWQALLLSKAGHTVTLLDRSTAPLQANVSRFAGAMLAPDCEAEAAPAIVREHGHAGIRIWREHYDGLTEGGSLVIASGRDASEIERFARQTSGHVRLDQAAIGELEPDLAGRFNAGLHFADEAHMTTPHALNALLRMVCETGCKTVFGPDGDVPDIAAYKAQSGCDIVIDCRGMGAGSKLSGLRGVRGERVVVRSREVQLGRPVRLLHPRHPLYVVPWEDGVFMVGATVIESEDDGPASVRSILELLGTAYALHPALAEAEIVDIGAGVRPAFADNVPRAIVNNDAGVISVNGAYRHGFLLAPVLAQAVVSRLRDAKAQHPLLIEA